MSYQDTAEPWEPAVPDEPYSVSDADCPQCGAFMPAWCCPSCGITEDEIAERLTGRV